MDEVTQQNAALVEEAAAAAESLEEQAGNLAQAVGAFRLSSATTRKLGSGFDFEGATDAHAAWKHRLAAFVAGRGEPLDATVVSSDHHCELGGWIYGPGKHFAKYSEYEGLRSAHQSFHRCAGEVVKLSQAKRRDDAKHKLENEFATESSTTIKCLYAMKGVASGAQERRGPNRAPNVARLRSKPASAQPAAPRPKMAAAGGSSEEQWEEF